MRVGFHQDEVARKGWAMTAAEAIAVRGRPEIAIVDLREKSERERHGIVPGSLHAPYVNLQDEIGAGGMLHELAAASKKRLVFLCAFGERSAMAVQAAQDAGLKTACHIAGGIDAWKKADGPLVH
jgi:rhodanese-related sulfurtransferase